jgi:hypothetical protein
MMRRLLQAVGFVFGLMVVVSLGMLVGARQGVSGAYWLLENGYISLSSQPALYRALPDGRGRRLILVDEAPYQDSVWPADVNHLYYATHEAAGFTVRRIRYGGRDQHTIIEPRPADITTTWPSPLSPDGKHMVFVFYGGGVANGIIRTDADGSDPRAIFEGNLYGYEGLIWSPDSQWIYFAATGDSGGGNFRLSVDGERLENLSDLGRFGTPIWMMGGERVVFTEGTRFYAIDGVEGELESLFTFPPTETERMDHIYRVMAISDEDMVVIAGSIQHQVSTLPSWEAAFRVNVGTGEIVQLTPFGTLMGNSVLTTDMEWLVYAGDVGGVHGIYRVRLDGSGRERLFAFGEAKRFVDFENTPDGRWVIVSYLGQGTSLVLKRVRIGLKDGRIERMQDGASVDASPLVDLDWNWPSLLGIGVGLKGMAVGLGLWGRKL